MTERRSMTPDEVNNAIDIAIIKTKMDQVEKSNIEQNKKLDEMKVEQNKKLDDMALTMAEISKILENARGSWKTLVWLGGAIGVATSTITWLLSHWK